MMASQDYLCHGHGGGTKLFRGDGASRGRGQKEASVGHAPGLKDSPMPI